MKKVLSIIALCLIAVIAGTIIVFACIDKNHNPNLTAPDYIEVYINKSAGAESYYKNDEDATRKAVYDNVMDLYNGGFTQKIMSGLFQGILFDKTEIVYEGGSISSILSNGTYIAFNYNDEQTLKLNGEVYSRNNETNIKYKTLYVEVKDTTAMTDINIYVKKLNSNYTYYRYVVKAEQGDLYNYLQDNFA